MWVWYLKCTLSHAFYEVLSLSLAFLATFAFSSWFIFVFFPLHFSAECMSFLSFSLTVLMTVDSTCIDNGPFGSKSRFYVS